MNPFTLLNHELTTDNSSDDVSAAFRFLCPLWADIWDDSPASYENAYDVIVAKVRELSATPLRERMLRFATELAQKRATAAYAQGY